MARATSNILRYADLGLEPGADVSSVKKAFRKMSIKYHPDKTGNGEESFARIEPGTSQSENCYFRSDSASQIYTHR